MLIKGKELSDRIIMETRYDVDTLAKKPKIKIFMFGDDPASETYVGKKIEAFEDANISYSLCQEKNIEMVDAKRLIQEANSCEKITAIMIQLPLPDNLDQNELLEEVSPIKDVDCLTSENLGRLFKGDPRYLPCTPQGILVLLKENRVNLMGKFVCIINSSNIVGKPLFHMILKKKGVPFVCNIDTPENIKLEMIKKADIVISAVGKKGFLRKEMLDQKSIVVDVGITREGKKIYGDVDFEKVKDHVLAVTPVPGGVGPMTVAMLVKNVCKSATFLDS